MPSKAIFRRSAVEEQRHDTCRVQTRRFVSQPKPPTKVAPPLAALWWAAKGDWDKAHGIVMKQESREAAWVHAYLHRVEGDLDNAGYWYRRARRPAESGPLEAEWDAIATSLIEEAEKA